MPPVADQTVVPVPLSVAVNCWFCAAVSAAVFGEIVPVPVVAVTVTDAVEVLVGSAAAVAVMMTVAAVAGAVKRPDAEIVPALADS